MTALHGHSGSLSPAASTLLRALVCEAIANGRWAWRREDLRHRSTEKTRSELHQAGFTRSLMYEQTGITPEAVAFVLKSGDAG